MKYYFIVFLFLLSILNQNDILSQNDSLNTFKLGAYTITFGKDYYIQTIKEKIIFGKIVGFNNDEILVKTDNEIATLRRDNINSITTDYPNINDTYFVSAISKYRTIWSIGGGPLFPLKKQKPFNASHNTQSAADFRTGFSFSASGCFPLNNNSAVRIEFDYSHIPNGDNYNTGTRFEEHISSSHQTGGNLDEFSFRGGVGTGNFGSEEKLNFGLFLSLGLGVVFKEESVFYINETGSYPPDNIFVSGSDNQLLISIGLSTPFRIKLKNNFGIFFEPQVFAYVAIGSYNMPAQLSLKTGIYF
jgi:hypothetical protein